MIEEYLAAERATTSAWLASNKHWVEYRSIGNQCFSMLYVWGSARNLKSCRENPFVLRQLEDFTRVLHEHEAWTPYVWQCQCTTVTAVSLYFGSCGISQPTFREPWIALMLHNVACWMGPEFAGEHGEGGLERHVGCLERHENKEEENHGKTVAKKVIDWLLYSHVLLKWTVIIAV